jgi:hypothetical protein
MRVGVVGCASDATVDEGGGWKVPGELRRRLRTTGGRTLTNQEVSVVK